MLALEHVELDERQMGLRDDGVVGVIGRQRAEHLARGGVFFELDAAPGHPVERLGVPRVEAVLDERLLIVLDRFGMLAEPVRGLAEHEERLGAHVGARLELVHRTEHERACLVNCVAPDLAAGLAERGQEECVGLERLGRGRRRGDSRDDRVERGGRLVELVARKPRLADPEPRIRRALVRGVVVEERLERGERLSRAARAQRELGAPVRQVRRVALRPAALFEPVEGLRRVGVPAQVRVRFGQQHGRLARVAPRRVGVDVLGEIGRGDVVQPLGEMRHRPHVQLPRRRVRALGSLGGRQADHGDEHAERRAGKRPAPHRCLHPP